MRSLLCKNYSHMVWGLFIHWRLLIHEQNLHENDQYLRSFIRSVRYERIVHSIPVHRSTYKIGASMYNCRTICAKTYVVSEFAYIHVCLLYDLSNYCTLLRIKYTLMYEKSVLMFKIVHYSFSDVTMVTPLVDGPDDT